MENNQANGNQSVPDIIEVAELSNNANMQSPLQGQDQSQAPQDPYANDDFLAFVKEQYEKMPEDQQQYYDLCTEKAKACSMAAYLQDKDGYPHDVIIEGRNTFLNFHGFRKQPDGSFNLKGQKKGLYYNEKQDSWQSKQPGHIAIKYMEGWHKATKYVATSAKGSGKSSKKKKTDLDRSREQLRKAQAQSGGSSSLQQERLHFSELDQQKTSKISNSALINFTATSIQKNNQLLNGPPKDCLSAAKIAVKKIETMLLAELYDYEQALQACQQEPNRFDTAALTLVYRSREPQFSFSNDLKDLLVATRGVIPNEVQLAPEEIDEFHAPLLIENVRSDNDDWMNRREKPFWTEELKWSNFCKPQGNQNIMRRYFQYQLRFFLENEIGEWSSDAGSLNEVARLKDALRKHRWDRQLKTPAAKAFMFLVDWSKIFGNKGWSTCDLCGQLEYYKNEHHQYVNVPHCSSKHKGGQQYPSQLTGEPFPFCSTCDLVPGLNEKSYAAVASHNLEYHHTPDSVDQKTGVKGIVYQKILMQAKKIRSGQQEDGHELLEKAETKAIEKIISYKASANKITYPKSGTELRALADTSEYFRAGKVFFASSKECETVQSYYVPKGVAINFKGRYLKKLDKFIDFRNLVMFGRAFERAADDDQLAALFATMRVWIFDHRHNYYSLHYEWCGNNLSHYITPELKATSVDYAWKMLGELVRTLLTMGETHGLCIHSIDLSKVFENLNPETQDTRPVILLNNGSHYVLEGDEGNPLPRGDRFRDPEAGEGNVNIKGHSCQGVIRVLLAFFEFVHHITAADIASFYIRRTKEQKTWRQEITEKQSALYRNKMDVNRTWDKLERILRGRQFTWEDIHKLWNHKPGTEAYQQYCPVSRLPMQFAIDDEYYQKHPQITEEDVNNQYGLDCLVSIPRSAEDHQVERLMQINLLQMFGPFAHTSKYEDYRTHILMANFLEKRFGLQCTHGGSLTEERIRLQILVVTYCMRIAFDRYLQFVCHEGDEANKVVYFLYLAKEFSTRMEIQNTNHFKISNTIKILLQNCSWTSEGEFTAVVTQIIPPTNRAAETFSGIQDTNTAILALKSMKLERSGYDLNFVLSDLIENAPLKKKSPFHNFQKKKPGKKGKEEQELSSSTLKNLGSKLEVKVKELGNYYFVDMFEDETASNLTEGDVLLETFVRNCGIANGLCFSAKPEFFPAFFALAFEHPKNWHVARDTEDDWNTKTQDALSALAERLEKNQEQVFAIAKDVSEVTDLYYQAKYDHADATYGAHNRVCWHSALFDEGIIGYKAVGGAKEPVHMLNKEIMLALYYALGFPGPRESDDWIQSAVEKSAPSEQPDYACFLDAVMCPWSGFKKLIDVWPLISSQISTQFHLTGELETLEYTEMFTMSVAKLKRLFVNAFFYFRHEVDLVDWAGVNYRRVLQFQIQAFCNPEFLQEWRASIPAASDIRGYLALVKPTKLGKPMPTPEYIQEVNESKKNFFVFKENDPEELLNGNKQLHRDPKDARSIVKIEESNFQTVQIAEPPLAYDYSNSLMTIRANDPPQRIPLGNMAEYFRQQPIYKTMASLVKKKEAHQRNKKDTASSFLINLEEETTFSNVSYNSQSKSLTQTHFPVAFSQNPPVKQEQAPQVEKDPLDELQGLYITWLENVGDINNVERGKTLMNFVKKNPMNMIALRIKKSIQDKDPEFYEQFEKEFQESLFP